MNFRGKFFLAKKWSILVGFTYLFLALQSSLGCIAISNIKPNIIIPFSIACSSFLNRKDSAIFGIVAGLFWDCFSSKIFGSSAIVLLIFCVFVSLICSYFAKNHLISSMILTVLLYLVYSFFNFMTIYLRNSNEIDNIWSLWGCHILPTAIYSMALYPIIYLLSKWLFKILENKTISEEA